MQSTSDNFKCLLCESERGKTTGKHPRDRKEADIIICQQCGLVQMYPLLTNEEETELYNLDRTIRFEGNAGGSEFEDMRIKFSEWTKQHVDIYFDKLQQFNNILEIGAGYGFFMEALNAKVNKHFNIEGIEIGEFRCENFVGGVLHNINILSDEIPNNMRNNYDCIISTHVLEHIVQPIKFLRRAKDLCKPGGVAIFEVPNTNCLLCELSPEYSDFWYLYTHCSYFTADTLKFAFEKAGYIITDIYTKEIYSIENHCRWIRDGVPFTKYNQMFLPDERIEWINEMYKQKIGEMGKGYSLIIEATL